MCDIDNLETESEPLAKKTKLYYDTQSSDSSLDAQQSSQWSQDNNFENGYNQDWLNTTHTFNVIVNNRKKERQKRYREQNREKLKQREAERRKRKQDLQINTESASSDKNRIDISNNKITDANSQSLSSLEELQASTIQENKQAKEKEALQKKRACQQRYRERNRDKLKQREAERRQRQQNPEIICQLVELVLTEGVESPHIF